MVFLRSGVQSDEWVDISSHEVYLISHFIFKIDRVLTANPGAISNWCLVKTKVRHLSECWCVNSIPLAMNNTGQVLIRLEAKQNYLVFWLESNF